jgi:hypothetical protein
MEPTLPAEQIPAQHTHRVVSLPAQDSTDARPGRR